MGQALHRLVLQQLHPRLTQFLSGVQPFSPVSKKHVVNSHVISYVRSVTFHSPKFYLLISENISQASTSDFSRSSKYVNKDNISLYVVCFFNISYIKIMYLTVKEATVGQQTSCDVIWCSVKSDDVRDGG